MPAVRLATAVCSALAPLAVLLALSPAVHAAPPAPGGDSVAAAPTAALDVLANDSDPEAGALSISGNTQPANGTASCSARGACFYSAAPGFVGDDAFSYTVRDAAGETAVGQVTVSVSEGTTTKALIARDDEVATPAGQALTIEPLANDNGTGIELAGTGTVSHGSLACTGATCTYTPASGYTGTDGFTYMVEDDGAITASAQVHIIVAPAGTGYAATSAGGPSTVAPGGTADYTLGAAATPAGISGQALRALPAPSLTGTLEGPQVLAGGGLKAAPGWTAATAGDGRLRVDAGSGALLGEAHSQAFPKPLPPISQGTGGDGHVPILVGSKVFAFYHHQAPTAVTCVDRTTAKLCPGYPDGGIRLNVASTDINGPGVVVGQRIYTHLLPAGSEFNDGYVQSASIALFCWDAETNSTCGLIIVDRVPQTGNPGASAPILADGRIWFGGDTGKLYCVDPATNDVCADRPAIDMGIGTSAKQNYDSIGQGTRVFVARRDGKVACVDVAANRRCVGWAAGQDFGGFWNLVNRYDATGAISGICVFEGASGTCLAGVSPSQKTPVSNFPMRDTYEQGYAHTLEAETGTRTLVGSLSSSGLGCYDWVTMAPCTGGDYDATGWITVEDDGDSLPSAYSPVWDGSCAVAVGDPGRIFTVDPSGTSPCLSLRSGASPTRIDLRDQRCDGTVGAARWQEVVLSDVAPGEMETVTVTVRDATTNEVLASGDLVAGGGRLDVSGIDVARHPALVVDASVQSAPGNTAWDDAIPPRITLTWKADPQQACAQARTTAECAAEPTTPIGLLAQLAGPAAVESRTRLTLQRPACPATLPPPAVVPTPLAEEPPESPILACTRKKVVLVDVLRRKGRVQLFGEADPTLIGRTVNIVFFDTGKRVARARIRPDGTFRSTAPLPARRVRSTNRARYQAVVGKERSDRLKLIRRVSVDSISSRGGKVTIRGRLSRPLAKPIRPIQILRRVSCTKLRVVKTFKPSRSGAFRTTFEAPAGQRSGVYVVRTFVRKTVRSKRPFLTKSLPRPVVFR